MQLYRRMNQTSRTDVSHIFGEKKQIVKECISFSSVRLSCSVMSDFLQHHGTPGFPVHQQLPELAQTHVRQVSDAIQPSHPLSSPSPPTFNLSQHQGLLKWEFFESSGQSIRVSASTSILPMNTQDWSPLGCNGWISCSPRDSQESSPAPQFKSINSSALSFLYSPTLTSIHDYWRSCSLDQMDLCCQSNVSAF